MDLLFFFFIFLKSIFLRQIKGFLLKKTSIYIYFSSFLLHYFIIFFKNNLILRLGSLMDICGVDLSLRISNKVELIYCFLNYSYFFRFFFRFFVSFFSLVFSLINFFSSSN